MDKDNSRGSVNVQWFPGHMKKALRMMEDSVKLVDIVAELIDARIPLSSRNPALDGIIGSKPRLIILNRADLADPAVTSLWKESFAKNGVFALETDSKSGKGVGGFPAAVREALRKSLSATPNGAFRRRSSAWWSGYRT